jgi:hypothetical protein
MVQIGMGCRREKAGADRSDAFWLTIKTTCVLPYLLFGLAQTENSTYLLPSLYNRYVEN